MLKAHYYTTASGRKPFWEWHRELDRTSRYRVDRYVYRVCAGGSLKNIKHLGDGVLEIKVDWLRVYFAYEGDGLLLLLGGGKGSQQADIVKAKRYWRNYVEEK